MLLPTLMLLLEKQKVDDINIDSSAIIFYKLTKSKSKPTSKE